MFVVPMRRAISSEALTLVKSREGATMASHKYIKRERYYVKGKPAWRYYYKDDLQRDAAKQHLDPKNEHEHLLIGQIKDIHTNLQGGLPTATEASLEKLRSYFKKAKIEASPAFKAKYIDPYIERERKGEDTGRESVLARLAQALALVPKDVLAYLDEEMTGIRFREPNLDIEFEAKEGLQAFADPLDGALVMLGNRSWTREPKGEARFNSPGNATGAEEVLWHELGHHWHNRFMKENKSGWADWVAINAGSEAKISDYATTNVLEDFAETFSCALSHPKELLERCPARYFFMRKYVIKSLPVPTALNAKGDEELAWWLGAARSSASKILRYLKGKNPASRYHAYYSSKDQFFQMSQGGHTLYFRYGPSNKDDEALWKPVGNIFDEVTGLPRYDVEYGQFFRMADAWKEIYDERGNPLDTKQAYFYLEQGNPAAEALLSGVNKFKNYDEWTEARKAGTADDVEEPEEGETPEGEANPTSGPSGPSGEAKEKRPKSWKDTHTVDYRLYSLGGRTGNTIEKERKRVEKDTKAGGTGYMPRHEYAPTEISGEEFARLSGTFKLGGMAGAPAERQVWRAIETDPKTKQQRTLTAIDVVTGEPVPALRARVYEQKNADGTYARIEVNESAPFMPGNTIDVPGEDGWERWTIPDGFDPTPARIAREFNTTARRILERNGRFTRGQIMNPILAALINPTGKPIEDEATLQQLMRAASEGDPPSRAWVTVRGSGDLDSSLAHMQVEFDGQGAPRVLGDYWRILTDNEDLRIDDLLNKDNTLKIKLPRIAERPRVKLPVESGNNVWVIDPKTKKRVMGVLVKQKKNESGETIYNVQAYIGQGAGVSKTVINATEVQAAYNDEIPGKEYRRRFVEPMDKQVLLYADNVKRDSGPYSTSGVIRLALPKDGSLTWENLSGIPGLQFEYEVRNKKQGTKFITGATLSLNNFSDFREGLGGFAMDERVQNMVQARMDSERILQSRTKTTLKDTDFVGEDGYANPEGVLRGLPTGRGALQPAAHQIDALKKLAANGGRMLAAHYMGCLSGDSVINLNRAGKGFKLPIRDLYERFNGTWGDEISTYGQSVFGDFVRLNEVLSVVDSGMKETFELRTKSGRSLRATAMHPFWTPTGWVSLGDLREGDTVGVLGLAEARGRAPKTYKYPFRTALYKHPYAGVRGAATSPYRVPTHRLVAEAHLNELELEAFVLRCRNGDVEGLQFLDPKTHAVHHKDEDTLNLAIENLEVLTHEEHWRKHGEQSGWTNFNQFCVSWDEVVFVGDEKEEHTYDICMHVASQSYVANDFIVHNTGKTALGLMASQMMRNLTDPKSPDKAHPNRLTKKTLILVPLNTAQNWYQEHKRFMGAAPTMIGAASLAGAQQIFKLDRVTRKVNEQDDAYYSRALTAWKEACKTEPNLWNPWSDHGTNVTASYEYFRDNEALMRATGLFDGMVIDEAHKIFRENEVSNAVERWNPSMKMFLMLTGTPVTNTLKILPRMVQLITAGKVSLADTPAEFEERHLIESQVLKAMGAKNPAKTDINPKRAGELAAKLQPLIHVATIADVKGKTMPSILLDENEPAHMIGSQNLQYRAAVAALTDEDRTALETSGALGVDEQALLSDEGKKRIALARSIANSPGYKAPDQAEYVTFQEEQVDTSDAKSDEKKGHGRKEKKVKKQTIEFSLPDHERMTAKQPKGWGGKWPSWDWVEKGYMSNGEMKAWVAHMNTALGVDFDHASGTTIDPAMLAALKKDGVWRSPTGVEWPGKLKNPEYGPEGVIARGTYDEVTGITSPIVRQFYDSTKGQWETITVPVGKRFIRDPNKKAAAIYYDSDDWQGTGRFHDTGEAGDEDKGLGGDDEEGDSEESAAEAKGKVKKNEQKPKEGREAFNINRHPAMRKSRMMFDIALTTNNAKCSKLEENMRNVLSGSTGDYKRAAPQMILFGNRVGSSVRCMEGKLRTMGYMDVNEALGHPDWSSEHDKARGKDTHKFFVTYMGKAATLGDRDLNSEIFRRQQDDLGKDTGTSMMTWRCLYGSTSSKLPKDGEILEGWSRAERKRIANNFVGMPDKDGNPRGLEVPMRVMGAQLKDGSLGQKYLYESSMKPKDRSAVQDLDIKLRGAVGAEAAKIEAELAAIFKPYWSTKVPLTTTQMDIFDHTEVMLASDAANVGLNWPAQHMVMYDSLFSMMDEWQRIARAARMLPDVVSKELTPLMNEIETHVKAIEEKNSLREYDVEGRVGIAVINEAMGMLSPDARRDLAKLPGGAPDQILEAFFAKRALRKISNLRAATEDRLRKQGAVPDPNKPISAANYISPKAIVSTDVINEIIRHELTPFERKCLADRRYLVDVKRLTVSAAVPVMKKLKDGQRVPARDENGQITYMIESPVQAERSILAQGRSKAVPAEYALNLIQNAEAQPTKFDMIGTSAAQLAELSLLPEHHLDRPVFRGRTQKSMRHVINNEVFYGHP